MMRPMRRAAVAVGVLAGAILLAGLLWEFGVGVPGGARPRGEPLVTPSTDSPGATPAPASTDSPPPSSPAAQAAPSSSDPRATVPPISVEQGRISGVDPSGRVQWELSAAAIDVEGSGGGQLVRLDRVEGTFYENGKPAITFTAPRAFYRVEPQEVTLEGGVRARASSGRLLEADRVEWKAARKLIVATGNVRLVQENMTVRGDRLESDVALRKTRLTGRVRVTVRE